MNPFTSGDIGQVLPGPADRLAAHTSALHRAKTAGRPVADVVADLAHVHRRELAWQVVLDIGYGRGSSTQALAAQLRRDILVDVHASTPMLLAGRRRIPGTSDRLLSGELRATSTSSHFAPLAVAAFCLYHSLRHGDEVPKWR